MIQITVNGEGHRVPDGLSLSQLLEHLGLQPKRIAAERNGRIVRRGDFESERICEDDNIVLVQIVGGG